MTERVRAWAEAAPSADTPDTRIRKLERVAKAARPALEALELAYQTPGMADVAATLCDALADLDANVEEMP